MSGTVFIVMCHDGNVCCPAEDLDSVWMSPERAASRASVVTSAGNRARVVEVVVDAEPEPGGW